MAWRRQDQIPADALPWLLGVARRVLANQRRGDARREALMTRLRAASTSQTVAWEAPSDLPYELAAALAALSEREREALLLVAWDGLDLKRAAVAAGCSPSAFRVRLHRARRHVANHLAASTAHDSFHKPNGRPNET